MIRNEGRQSGGIGVWDEILENEEQTSETFNFDKPRKMYNGWDVTKGGKDTE